ncbi:hypothetical protein D9M68_978250 [compost metagenome]
MDFNGDPVATSARQHVGNPFLALIRLATHLRGHAPATLLDDLGHQALQFQVFSRFRFGGALSAPLMREEVGAEIGGL